MLLEWDYSKGEPDAPMVKDVYHSERQKAKILNFSIAYGKTPFGLAKDWGVTVKAVGATATTHAFHAFHIFLVGLPATSHTGAQQSDCSNCC